jgi:hypothetical protein
MKRTLVVLALAVLSAAGCRAIGPNRNPGCGDACGDCSEPCHVTRSKYAPQPVGCDAGCGPATGRGGNLEADCPGGSGCMFDRYSGHNCGPGHHPGPYDCSPCNSPHWGWTGHRHPQGYVDGQRCMCQVHGKNPCQPCPHPGPKCSACGHGYCCTCMGPPAPGCPNSGDHAYNFAPGPPTGQTAYPYYTLRGPRDFLLDTPPSIGPY